MAELSGNKAIEDAPIHWVMDLERTAGREPRDIRYQGTPADIESPPRLIEVKSFGTSNRGYDLWLEVRQVQEVKANPDFYVYVVENVRQGDPALFTLRVLGGERLQHLIGARRSSGTTRFPGRSPTTTAARPRCADLIGPGPSKQASTTARRLERLGRSRPRSPLDTQPGTALNPCRLGQARDPWRSAMCLI